jgi:hypothetical protein
LCGRMNMVIVCELTEGQESVPVVLSFTHKDPNVLLEFLIDALGLTIRLWVIGCRCRKCDP